MGSYQSREEFERIVTRIRDRMVARGENPTSLSLKIGPNRWYIRDLLRGLDEPERTGVPKAARLQAIAEALETTVDYLTGKTDDPSLEAADLIPKTPEERRLLEIADGLSDDEIRELTRYGEFLRQRQPQTH